jgi:hypothetical protein
MDEIEEKTKHAKLWNHRYIFNFVIGGSLNNNFKEKSLIQINMQDNHMQLLFGRLRITQIGEGEQR